MPENIVVLGTYSDPALGYQLDALVRAGFGPQLHVFLDPKEPGIKEIGIWEERTEGRLPGLPLTQFSQLPFHFLDNHNSGAAVTLMRDLGAVLAVNCGTPRILRSDVLIAPALGVLNIHPGKLPDYRGCTCVEWAVYNDDPVYLTAHIMRDEIDYGPIICQQRVPVVPGELYSDVRVKVFETAYDLLPLAVRAILDGRENISKLPMPNVGRYWKVIEQDKLEQVKRKLQDGRYGAAAARASEIEFMSLAFAAPQQTTSPISAVLQEGDLRLEPFAYQHLSETYLSWLRDKALMKFSEQRHRSHDAASCRDYLDSMRRGGHGFWAIMLRDGASWRHVGNITASIDYPNQVADVGILVGDKSIQGRGIGRRAWALVCKHLLGAGGMRKISAGTMGANEPMLRIMRGVGMIEEGVRRGQFMLDGRPTDLVTFALFKPAEL